MDYTLFENYEELTCDICKKKFLGRRPVEGGYINCPDCIVIDLLPIVDISDEIPETVNEHIEGGEEDE